MKALLELVSVKKDYLVDSLAYPALLGIDIKFPHTGFVSVLGPSGCGKTTLLNIVGGLDKPTSGELIVEGKSTKDFKSADWDAYRNARVGFVFQSYNLIGHLSVLDNVETALVLSGEKAEKRKEKALNALRQVGLEDVVKKQPNQLSGGQMQRVAIARALANDPQIILADEPTGALDSKTSVQVMEILKDLSKNHLVIMVTHNEKLAKKYSDRIISMKDGLIVSDEPSLIIDEQIDVPEKIAKKTSMGPWTAIKHSLKNISSKKGRTTITAIACSFGIIGVALVMAASNGLNSYIANVETSVASTVPIVVSPSVYDYSSANDGVSWTRFPDEENIYVYDNSSSSYLIHRNAYDRQYFDYIDQAVEDGLASSVLYNRQYFRFNVITKSGNTDQYQLVEQYNSAGYTGSVVSSATGLPATVFHELYGEEESLSSLYTTIYGRFPEAADEIVLVTDKYNRIELSTLEELGIVSESEHPSNQDTISFSELVYDYEGDAEYKEYKAYRTSDFFQLDDPNTVRHEYKVSNAVDITSVTPVDAGGNPVSSIANADHIKLDGEEKEKTFYYYETPYRSGSSLSSDLESVFENDAAYNPISLKIVGVLRPTEESIINLMPASLAYTKELSDILAADIEEGGAGYPIASLAKTNYWMSPSDFQALQTTLSMSFSSWEEYDIVSTFSDLLNECYTYLYPWAYLGTIAGSTSSPSNYMSYCRMVGGDFGGSETKIDTSDYISLLSQFLEPGFFNGTQEDYNFIDLVAFSNGGSLITSILIFPVSISEKDELLAYLDAYNQGKADVDQIVYTDVMSTVTDTLAIVTTVVPSVLVVFASVSLVVSSVLTSIITYVSVLERSKEIGILRACGARKIDIARLFESECFLIGIISGLIGIFMAWICCFPINMVLDSLFPDYNLSSIASLNPWICIALVAVSVVLALLSGLIPAIAAAKKDPVEVLRSQ